jgi:hypothetical protein
MRSTRGCDARRREDRGTPSNVRQGPPATREGRRISITRKNGESAQYNGRGPSPRPVAQPFDNLPGNYRA